MLAWLLLAPAHAVDIEVRYLGYVETYSVAAGEQVHDVWRRVPVPDERRSARYPDVEIDLDVQAGDDSLAVHISVVEARAGAEVFFSSPTLVLDAADPTGEFALSRQVPVVDRVEGGAVHVRHLTQPQLEVTVRPDPE